METPQQRRLHSKHAAHIGWARTPDRSARTAPARAAFMGRWEKLADPDGVMAPEERQRVADQLMRAHFARMQYLSSKVRSERAARKAGGRDGA